MRKWIYAGGCLLVALAIWQVYVREGSPRWVLERQPTGIMGTSCLLRVVVHESNRDKASKMLDAAEARLRFVEAVASNWIEDSELSRLNAWEGSEAVVLSSTLETILRQAHEVYLESEGAFDITCRPLIELWREAGKKGRMPLQNEIQRARESSSWSQIEWGEGQIRKRVPGVRFDLGGIAKGHAIDEAVDVMMRLGAVGAMVEVGGDIKVLGQSPRRDGRWEVKVRDPVDEVMLTTLILPGGLSVCTSGDYARYVEIEGRRFSHIVDPRTGSPTSSVPSVTVIGERAGMVDAWATALSVLGEEGMALVPDGLEVFLLLREAGSGEFSTSRTPGFDWMP